MTQPPANLLWIVADDLGYGDLGCYGCADIPTPNLDALAGQGLRAVRHYAMPVCSPTRAALLTGRAPQAAGVEEALMGHGGLPANTMTMARWLRGRGYRTALVGKWHLGYEDAALPLAQGFDEHVGHLGGKLHYYRHTDELEGREQPDLWENGRPLQAPGVYSTDLFSERACRFIAENARRPFFLMLAYNAPHYARGRKPGEDLPSEHYIQAPPAYVTRFARDPAQPTLREMFTAAVSCMDDGIGRVLRALDQAGLRESTLVVFQSDHGADQHHGGGNGVLSGYKAQLCEGGIRVPMIARLPGVLPGGQVLAGPSDSRDLWSTSAALLGLGDLPPQEGVDGSAAWRGRPAGGEHDQCFAFRQERAVVRGRWKWLYREGVAHLYDVQEDPAEQRDLWASRQELAAELASVWARWASTWQKKNTGDGHA
jgi:arylsulfatase A-like enzyme